MDPLSSDSLSEASLVLSLLNIDNIGTIALGLDGAEVSDDTTQDVDGTEDPEYLGGTDVGIGNGEDERGQHSTNLTTGSGETVGETSDSGWESLGWDDESGGVGTEVEEELLKEGEADDESSWVMSHDIISTSDDPEHEGSSEETNQLDVLSAEYSIMRMEAQ